MMHRLDMTRKFLALGLLATALALCCPAPGWARIKTVSLYQVSFQPVYNIDYDTWCYSEAVRIKVTGRKMGSFVTVTGHDNSRLQLRVNKGPWTNRTQVMNFERGDTVRLRFKTRPYLWSTPAGKINKIKVIFGPIPKPNKVVYWLVRERPQKKVSLAIYGTHTIGALPRVQNVAPGRTYASTNVTIKGCRGKAWIYAAAEDRGGKGTERIMLNNRWYRTHSMQVPCGSTVCFAMQAPSQYSKVRKLKIRIENQRLYWLVINKPRGD
ncbi:MAG: hypothetical protein KQH53_07555 [Desulfarculaceae bacterium]|nr:hypothetical protein [Desulfarculaceae bacterium]